MVLTPRVLESLYTFLRQTPPFHRWKLPEADEVEFRVSYTDVFGHCQRLASGRFCIWLSAKRIEHTYVALEVMAHEMVHVRVGISDGSAHHGKRFRYHAAQVCAHHGFDRRAFC